MMPNGSCHTMRDLVRGAGNFRAVEVFQERKKVS